MTTRRAWLAGAGLVVLALAIAAVTLRWESIPQYDPSGWLLWGRELLGAQPFDTHSFPSWKPLGAVLGIVAMPFGSAAPAALLVIVRASAILGLVLAFRLAARASGIAAGVTAALAIATLPHWLELSAEGYVEPIILLLVLAAAELHVAGRRKLAFGLLAIAALGRVEVWPIAAAYGLHLAIRGPRRLALVVPAALIVPLVWFGGDALGSGSPVNGPCLASHAASSALQHAGGHGASVVFANARHLLPWPLWLLFGAGMAWAAWRRRATILAMGGAGLAWLATDVALAAHGYPGDVRFMVPAGGLLCVAAGASLGWLTLLRGPRALPLLAGSAACAALAVVVLVPRASFSDSAFFIGRFGEILDRVDDAVAAGRARGLVPRPGETYAGNHFVLTRVAWLLDVPAKRMSGLHPPDVEVTFADNAVYHDLLDNERRGRVRIRRLAYARGAVLLRLAWSAPALAAPFVPDPASEQWCPGSYWRQRAS